jgi:PAS domain S-box-containing protein
METFKMETRKRNRGTHAGGAPGDSPDGSISSTISHGDSLAFLDIDQGSPIDDSHLHSDKRPQNALTRSKSGSTVPTITNQTRSTLPQLPSSQQGSSDSIDSAEDVLPASWRRVFYNAPTPLVVLSASYIVAFVSKAAEELLGLEARAVEGRLAGPLLNLDSATQGIDLSTRTLQTRLNGRLISYAISHATKDDGSIEWHYLSIEGCSEPHRVLYKADFSKIAVDGGIEERDEGWAHVAPQILEQIPALIVALSKDGKHSYQNAFAQNTLGPIMTTEGTAEAWIRRQYGSARHADGTPFHHTELPIYRAAVDGISQTAIECHFGEYIYLLAGRPLYNSAGVHIGGMAYSADITKIKHEAAEKEQLAMAQSDIKFAQITNSMEQIVWVSVNGQKTYFNSRWYEYTGASEESSLGEKWYDYLHPDDVVNTKNNWLLLSHDEDRYIAHYRIRSAKGTYRWFIARAIATRSASGKLISWLGTSTDITQITEALEEAKQAKEQLFNIMQTAHIHYFVVNLDYLMSSVFLAGSQDSIGLYGRYTKREQLLRTDVRRIFNASLLKKLESVLSGVATSAIEESELNGTWWKTTFKVMRHQENKSVIGAVCTVMDVTDEKLKDHQLALANTERVVAMQNSQFKGEFLARMSHEIRTPIGGILGMVRLMDDALHPSDGRQVFIDPEQEKESMAYLDAIKRSGDALLVIINDILDFSKIEVGKMDIDLQPFDLLLMAQDIYQTAKHGSHLAKGVECKLEYLLPPKLIFKGDCNRIRQILMNLMSNALKFTEKGSVICRISLAGDNNLLPLASPDGLSRVKFEVIDTGIGITKSSLDKLFNPFVQADSSTARKFGGTGLGLSIAQQLVKLMSGAISLESIPAPEPGHGSRATCIIPLELSSSEALPPDDTKVVQKFTKPYQILLVEDNRINQVIARKTLEKLGLKSITVENGRECIDYLQANSSNLPDLVLMDCQMPLMVSAFIIPTSLY